MSKEDKIEVEGTIIQSLPGLVFEVQLPEDLWDKVTIELSPYDPGKGRITYRLQPEKTNPQT